MSGFDLAGSKATARLDRRGVLSGCAVTEQDPEAMAVDVAAGEVIFGYGVPKVVVAAASVSIAAAHATLDRVDLICVDGDGRVVVVEGVPAASPPLPYPNGRLVLAQVEVAAEAADIQTEAITDERVVLHTGGVPDAGDAAEGDLLTVDDEGGYGWAEPAAE